MPRRNQQYQYRVGDNPAKIAKQNGITPQQFFQANQGAYPFSTGQIINVPANTYQAGLQNNANILTGSFLAGGTTNPWSLSPVMAAATGQSYQYVSTTPTNLPRNTSTESVPTGSFLAGGTNNPFSNSPVVALGAGINQTSQGVNSTMGSQMAAGQPYAGSFSTAAAQAAVLDRLEKGDLSMLAQIPKEDLAALGITDVNAFAAQQQQQTNISAIQSGVNNGNFQRVKASENYGAFLAQESAFYNAKRWDPVKKKYVKIGALIAQGKLNEKTGEFNPYAGNKNRGGGGGGGGQQQQGFSGTTFGVVSFNAGSG